MLVRMADRGGGVTDMACGLLMRRSSCCHCSKKKKHNIISREKTFWINKGRCESGLWEWGGLGEVTEETYKRITPGENFPEVEKG